MARIKQPVPKVEIIGSLDPKNLPADVFDAGCRVLASCIRRALQDPKLKADFEKWQQERKNKAKEAET